MKKITILLLIPVLLVARSKTQFRHEHTHELPYTPLFTGPLLAPSAANPDPRHPTIEPFLGIFTTYGRYDSNWKFKNEKNIYAINPQIDYQMALSERTSVEVFASYVINYRDGRRFAHFQDTLLTLGYQLLDDVKDTSIPDLRVSFKALLPTGNHRGLDPILEGIDATGQGAYFFAPSVSAKKLFYLPHGYFSLRTAISYFIPTSTRVQGHNAYGGGFGTKGKIDPGQMLFFFVSGEYSFSRRWVFAFDTLLFHQQAAENFEGFPGVTETGAPAKVGLPAATQISVAPAIEYNVSENLGFIVGSWFSVAGRNDEAFASVIAAFIYVF